MILFMSASTTRQPLKQAPLAETGKGKREHLTIGELARACEVTIRTLRYYEEMDLIAPTGRSEGKYRLYHPRAIQRVQAIVALQSLSYSLDDILQLLGPHSESQTLDKAGRIAWSKRSLEAQQQGLARKLATLQAMDADIAQRLSLLEAQCNPCLEEHPEDNACDTCEYRAVHTT